MATAALADDVDEDGDSIVLTYFEPRSEARSVVTISQKLLNANVASKAKTAAVADHAAGIAAAEAEHTRAMLAANAAHTAAVALVVDTTTQATAAYDAAIAAFWNAASPDDQVLAEGDLVGVTIEELAYTQKDGVIVSQPLRWLITPDEPVGPPTPQPAQVQSLVPEAAHVQALEPH